MGSISLRSVIVLLCLVLVAPPDADAGNNAGGSAGLSWSPATSCGGPLCDLPSIDQPITPLYVLLENAPDVQQVQVTIRWHPFARLGDCYSFVPVTPDSQCGSAVSLPPGSESGEVTSGWGSIVFPPGSARNCVVYGVSKGCDSPIPADFCLVSVKTMDSAGTIDTIALTANATIMGGTASGCPAPGGVENNASGTIRLTWDYNNVVEAIPIPPPTPFPLFVHLSGAPDVRQLAVTLRWSPYDSLACYRVLEGSITGSCGWTAATLPGADCAGDSTYDWTIHFPPTMSGRSCFTHSVAAAGCDTAPPGKFYIIDARTKDSNGAIDRLLNVGDAKIIGGPMNLPGGPQNDTALQRGYSTLRLSILPNPSSFPVQLELSTSTEEFVVLGIHDVAGRLIRRLAAERVAPGPRTYRWDLKDAAGQRARAGVYFVRASTAQGSTASPVRTRRLLFLGSRALHGASGSRAATGPAPRALRWSAHPCACLCRATA